MSSLRLLGCSDAGSNCSSMLTAFWTSLAALIDWDHCPATFKDRPLGPESRLTELYFETFVTLLDGQIKANGETPCKFNAEHVIDIAGNVLQSRAS